MTFVAEEFERFRKGGAVFRCTTECMFAYGYHRGNWKTLHEKNQWRELAVAVVKVGYFNDLSYFLLGEAATGLGFREVAKTYYERALEARKAGRTCEGAFNTCGEFAIAERIAAVLGGNAIGEAATK